MNGDTLVPQEEHNIQAIQVSGWSGPIPNPEALARFEEICPGAADRILRMSEVQVKHRIEIEKNTNAYEAQLKNIGLRYAFGITILGIIISGIVVIWGNPWAGSIISITALAPIISKFIRK